MRTEAKPPIAAMSLTLTTIALYPRSRADVGPRRKCTSSTKASVVSTSWPAPEATTAASSPTPTTTSGPAPESTLADRLQQRSSSDRSMAPFRPFRGGVPGAPRGDRSVDSTHSSASGASGVAAHRAAYPRRFQVPRVHVNPSPQELRAFTEEMPQTRISEFKNTNTQTEVLCRSTASTYVVASVLPAVRRWTGRGVRPHRRPAGRLPRRAWTRS